MPFYGSETTYMQLSASIRGGSGLLFLGLGRAWIGLGSGSGPAWVGLGLGSGFIHWARTFSGLKFVLNKLCLRDARALLHKLKRQA
jgi:hypothetical protein